MASRSALDPRTRSEDSWVEISSQPSSSSLSSIGEEVVTTGLRVQNDPRTRRRRTLRHNAPTTLGITRTPSATGGASSQEEYEESESESDKVMSSSNEGPVLPSSIAGRAIPELDWQSPLPSDDDENRTAINHPLRNEECFTPQPNAFTHPPSGQIGSPNQPVGGSYFPSQRRESRLSSRPTLSAPTEPRRSSHMPQNILSPSYDPSIHDEALRTSLSTLLSCAAAARNLGKPETKRNSTATATQQHQPRSNRIDPMSFRLVPESAMQVRSPPHLREPTFNPTIRPRSTSTSTSSEQQKDTKRKAATGRSSSRERRSLKKARRASPNEDLHVTPTLLTWVVSAGVVVFLSALSFSAGYSIGKEAGRLEAGSFAADEQIRSCAREAGRSSLGLKRSLARTAVQV